MQACASESPISPENLRVTGPKSRGQWDESILRERMQLLCRGARKPRWSRATAQPWKSTAHDVVCGDAPVPHIVSQPRAATRRLSVAKSPSQPTANPSPGTSQQQLCVKVTTDAVVFRMARAPGLYLPGQKV